jgi:hypothetical protein
MKCKSSDSGSSCKVTTKVDKLLTVTFVFLTKKDDIFPFTLDFFFWTGVCKHFEFSWNSRDEKVGKEKIKGQAQILAVMLPSQANTYTILPTFLQYLPSFKTRELDSTLLILIFPLNLSTTLNSTVLKKIIVVIFIPNSTKSHYQKMHYERKSSFQYVNRGCAHSWAYPEQ